MLEKTPESPLDSNKIKPVSLKGNQPWIVIGRTEAETEVPVFQSSDANSRLIEKVPDAGKDWGKKKQQVSEDEMPGWHHWCNEHECRQILGDGDKESWQAAVHGIEKSQTRQGGWTTTVLVFIPNGKNYYILLDRGKSNIREAKGTSSLHLYFANDKIKENA